MSRARDRADGQDLTDYAPLASPDFTGTVDLTGTTVSLDDDEISLDKISGGTLGAGAIGSSVTGNDGSKLLSTQTVSGTSTVSFDGFFTSAYYHYKVMFHNVKAGHNGKHFMMRVRQSNADISTASNMSSISKGWTTTNSDCSTYYVSQTQAVLGPSDGSNAAGYGVFGELTFYNPLNSTDRKVIMGHVNGYDSGSPPTAFRFYDTFALFILNTAALSGFSLMFTPDDSSTIYGTFQLFGIKNS